MSKIVFFGKEAVQHLLAGVDFLANAVRITEGPRGRNAILGQRALGQSPRVTRDGVTVANYTDPQDPVMQIGADLIREAAQKTDNVVGDGTTASIVLAQEMIHAGFALINSGVDPMKVDRDLKAGAEEVVARLQKIALPVDDERVFQVATVSAHGDKVIGRLVADAIKAAGKNGIVTAEPSTTSETFFQKVAGLELDKSNLLSSAFITHPETMSAQLSDCRILLWEGTIGSARSLVPLLNAVHTSNIPLLIAAGGYAEEALALIINNKVRLALPLIAVRFDAYGQSRKDIMHDLVALCGGKAFTEDLGTKLENVQVGDLGLARKVITDMRKTQIIEGKGKQMVLQGVVDELQKELETATASEKPRLKKRLASLTGGITIIKVGGITVTEMEEKKDRVLDALSAAKAAVESGIVAGGGTALLRIGEELTPWINQYGGGVASQNNCEEVAVIKASCRAIATRIALNAGDQLKTASELPISIVKALEVPNPHVGCNAETGCVTNLVADGIIDPVAVIIEAVRNASSVARNILTMGCIIAENPEALKGERS